MLHRIEKLHENLLQNLVDWYEVLLNQPFEKQLAPKSSVR